MKYVTTKFNAEVFRKSWSNAVVVKQTKLLEDYAVQEMNKMAKTHDFKNDTYNLQDSLCWALYYNGEQRSYGFYGGGQARDKSFLHAWGKKESRVSVDGRGLAEAFVNEYEPTVKSGWEIIFAAVAPYGAYLELGSTPRGVLFRVISQEYDQIKRTLSSPCVVTFEINAPTY